MMVTALVVADYFRFEQSPGPLKGIQKEKRFRGLRMNAMGNAALCYLLDAKNAKNLAQIAEKYFAVFANYFAHFAIYFFR
jgi:hypothetical protein